VKDICRFQNSKWFTISFFDLKLIQCLSFFEESKLSSFKHGWTNKHVVGKKKDLVIKLDITKMPKKI
jgi:hypothetical protein